MAAGNDAAALVVALSAQITQFEKDLDKAGQVADRKVREIEARFQAANISAPGLDALGAKLKALAGGAGIGLLVRELIDLNRQVAQIGETAEVIGASTDELQKFRFAVVATGGSIGDADRFLERFTRSVGDAAKGAGDLYNFFRVNNIAAAEFAKLPLTAQLERFADLIKNTGTQAQRLNNVFLVGGRGSAQMVQALQEGAGGLRRFADEAEASGTVIDRELIARAKEINIEFEKLKLTFAVTAGELAVSTWDLLARSISNVVGGLGEFLNQFELLKRIGDQVKTGNLDLGGSGNLVPGVGFVPGQFPGQAVPQVTISKPSEPAPLPTPRPTSLGNGSTVQPNAQGESFEKLIQAQERRIQLLNAERESIGQTVYAETFLKTQIDLENQARQQNIPLTEARKNAITQEAIKTAEAAQALDDYKRAWKGVNDAAQFAGNQLIDILDGLRNKTLSLADAAKNLANNLIHALEQAVLLGQGPLAGVLGLGSNVQGGTGGAIGALLGSFGFGGAKAGGGAVNAGTAYLVGEKGPELFIPKGGGQIVPNMTGGKASGGGASITVNNYAAAETETQQRTQDGPAGEMVVIDIIRKSTARGDFDDINRARFGLRANKVR